MSEDQPDQSPAQLPDQSPPTQPRRMPLWRSAAEALLASGLAYDQIIPATWFEEHLSKSRHDQGFSPTIHKVRKKLEHHGFYLKKQKDVFVIIPANKITNQLKTFTKRIRNNARRGFILGTTTPLSALSPAEAKKHEKAVEVMANMGAVIQHYVALAKIGQKKFGNQARKLKDKAA